MTLHLGGAPQRLYWGGDATAAYLGSQLVWEPTPQLPLRVITGTSIYDARDKFRQACRDFGTSYNKVVRLPFRMDTSKSTDLRYMFQDCSKLVEVHDLATSNVVKADQMFRNCSSLTDGNVRLIGKHPSVVTTSMLAGSGLTRLPFYDAAGNPI